jgi:hypothetical protein
MFAILHFVHNLRGFFTGHSGIKLIRFHVVACKERQAGAPMPTIMKGYYGSEH